MKTRCMPAGQDKTNGTRPQQPWKDSPPCAARRKETATSQHTPWHTHTPMSWMPTHMETRGYWIKGTLRPQGCSRHGRSPLRLLGIRYNMWLVSKAQRRYVLDGITEMACYLQKNRDVSIQNSLKLVECTLAPLLAFSNLVIIWPEKEFKYFTAAFVRCNEEAWHMSPNTSTALLTFPRTMGGLQINLPLAILCPAV